MGEGRGRERGEEEGEGKGDVEMRKGERVSGRRKDL